MNNIRYRYRLTPSAERELEREMDYSLKYWGRRHAKLYRQALLATIERIINNPLAYPERPDIGDNYRLVRYKGNYIVYSVNVAERYVEIMGFPNIHRDMTSR